MEPQEKYEKLAAIGIAYKGDYNPHAVYEKLNAVCHDGSVYVALKNSPTGHPEAYNVSWQYLPEGLLSLITAIDTGALLGAEGATVEAQTLIDAIADHIKTKLLPKTDVISQIINDPTKAASAAALYAVDQKVASNNIGTVNNGGIRYDTDVIFEGNAATPNSTHQLSNSIDDYDFVQVWAVTSTSSSGSSYKDSILIPREEYYKHQDVSDPKWSFMINATIDTATSSAGNRFISFGFLDSQTFKVGVRGGSAHIMRIYGFKKRQATYSTEETPVGTWIDGKTICKKVIDYGTINMNGESVTNIPHGVVALDHVIDYSVVLKHNTNHNSAKLPYVQAVGGSSYYTFAQITPSSVDIYNNATWSDYSVCIVIEYTKADG